jgi:hypothetical protein
MSSMIGQRGKDAEKAVEKLLGIANNRIFEFAWHRYPDTRAARGLIQAQPCDYLIACGGAFHLEVKSTKHDYRLTRDKLSQLPRLLVFSSAGIPFVVLVYHSVLRQWRCVPGEFFAGDLHAPSWNLKGFQLYPNVADALLASGWFPEDVFGG